MLNEQEKETAEQLVNPHDKVFKNFLGEKETAKSFFQEYLPAEISKDIDFSTLKISKDTFVDKRLSDYYSDLLYEVKLRDMRVFIYLLIEHKSWLDRFTAFQLLKYMIKIWELFLKQNEKAKILPVILPLVIYHGPQKWKINKNFISLFDDNTPGYVRDYIPDFRYNLHDISHLPDEEIKGVVLLRIILKTLKYIFTPGFKHKLEEVFRLFRELKDKNKGTEYLEVLLRYLTASVSDLTKEELKDSVTKIFIEGGNIMATIAEKWLEEGREKGRKEGREKGRIEIAKIMKNKGEPIEKIAEYTGLSRKEVEKLAVQT